MGEGEAAVPPGLRNGSTFSATLSTARIVLLAALGLLILSGVAFAGSEALHRDRTSVATVVSPVHRIVVNSDAGNVSISAGLTADVVIHRRDAWLVDRPDVTEHYHDGVLEIDTACGHLKAVLRCRSNLSIDAPPEVDVAIRTKSGDVDLRGLEGRADIETDSGNISTHRLEPVTVTATTDAGDVSLDLFGQPTRTQVKSDAGDVSVTVPYGMYHVDATADGGGNVKVAGVIRDDLAPHAIDAVTDVGNVTVRAR
jgi:Putative adhesin